MTRLRRLSALSGRFQRKPERDLDRENLVVFRKYSFERFDRIDGESMDIEWKYSQDSQQIQEFMKEQQCDPEQFSGKIIFVSMFNDIMSGEEENEEKCKK